MHRVVGPWVWDDIISKDYTIEQVALMHACLWSTGRYTRHGLRPVGCMFVVDQFEQHFPDFDTNVDVLRSLVTLGAYTKDWLTVTYGFRFP